MRANRILNAYQAVLGAINMRCRPAPSKSPTTRRARPNRWSSPAPNLLQPLGETTLSNGFDWDFHRFDTTEYADITVVLNYVRPLGGVGMELLPDDPDTLAFENVSDISNPGRQVITLRQAPPGGYVVKVRGGAPNYYTLRVILAPVRWRPTVSRITTRAPPPTEVRLRARNQVRPVWAHIFFQGGYDANIQNPADVDWYHVTDIGDRALCYPCCQLSPTRRWI